MCQAFTGNLYIHAIAKRNKWGKTVQKTQMQKGPNHKSMQSNPHYQQSYPQKYTKNVLELLAIAKLSTIWKTDGCELFLPAIHTLLKTITDPNPNIYKPKVYYSCIYGIAFRLISASLPAM